MLLVFLYFTSYSSFSLCSFRWLWLPGRCYNFSVVVWNTAITTIKWKIQFKIMVLCLFFFASFGMEYSIFEIIRGCRCSYNGIINGKVWNFQFSNILSIISTFFLFCIFIKVFFFLDSYSWYYFFVYYFYRKKNMLFENGIYSLNYFSLFCWIFWSFFLVFEFLLEFVRTCFVFHLLHSLVLDI